MEFEQRKHQFFLFSILLLIIGFLQYFRKIVNGYKLTKVGKILYITTMIVFIMTTMIVLYFTKLNNLVSFSLGLLVTTMSEHIAKLFLLLGDNFSLVIGKILNKTVGVDLTKELKKLDKDLDKEIDKKYGGADKHG